MKTIHIGLYSYFCNLLLILLPITHFCYVSKFLDELTTVLESMIYFLQRFYLLVKEEKCDNYGRTINLQTLALVPATEPGTGSGTGTKFSSDRVLVRNII